MQNEVDLLLNGKDGIMMNHLNRTRIESSGCAWKLTEEPVTWLVYFLCRELPEENEMIQTFFPLLPCSVLGRCEPGAHTKGTP